MVVVEMEPTIGTPKFKRLAMQDPFDIESAYYVLLISIFVGISLALIGLLLCRWINNRRRRRRRDGPLETIRNHVGPLLRDCLLLARDAGLTDLRKKKEADLHAYDALLQEETEYWRNRRGRDDETRT